MSVCESRIVTVTIERPWRDVYGFACVPENFQRWAGGLGSNFKRDGEEWRAEGPGGQSIRIRFTAPNDFGVLDHTVRMQGKETHNAMRVVPNGSGAEVMFTLLKTPDMTREVFEADAAAVQHDLNALKALLERNPN